jgi:hypothetical protein
VDATRVHAPGEDHDDVCAEGLNLLLHLFTGTLADCYGADYRSDANDDAEHRQDRS